MNALVDVIADGRDSIVHKVIIALYFFFQYEIGVTYKESKVVSFARELKVPIQTILDQ